MRMFEWKRTEHQACRPPSAALGLPAMTDLQMCSATMGRLQVRMGHGTCRQCCIQADTLSRYNFARLELQTLYTESYCH